MNGLSRWGNIKEAVDGECWMRCVGVRVHVFTCMCVHGMGPIWSNPHTIHIHSLLTKTHRHALSITQRRKRTNIHTLIQIFSSHTSLSLQSTPVAVFLVTLPLWGDHHCPPVCLYQNPSVSTPPSPPSISFLGHLFRLYGSIPAEFDS